MNEQRQEKRTLLEHEEALEQIANRWRPLDAGEELAAETAGIPPGTFKARYYGGGQLCSDGGKPIIWHLLFNGMSIRSWHVHHVVRPDGGVAGVYRTLIEAVEAGLLDYLE